MRKTTGIVCFYLKEKGFGFITPDDDGPDIFLHRSELEKIGLQSIAKNVRVEFDAVPSSSRSKPAATNIKVLT